MHSIYFNLKLCIQFNSILYIKVMQFKAMPSNYKWIIIEKQMLQLLFKSVIIYQYFSYSSLHNQN